MLITLTNTDKKAIIDDKNYDRVSLYKWRLKESSPGLFYVATSIGRRTLYLHRFIMRPKPGVDVHHRNENTLDNQEENLEELDAPLHRAWHLHKRREKSLEKSKI